MPPSRGQSKKTQKNAAEKIPPVDQAIKDRIAKAVNDLPHAIFGHPAAPEPNESKSAARKPPPARRPTGAELAHRIRQTWWLRLGVAAFTGVIILMWWLNARSVFGDTITSDSSEAAAWERVKERSVSVAELLTEQNDLANVLTNRQEAEAATKNALGAIAAQIQVESALSSLSEMIPTTTATTTASSTADLQSNQQQPTNYQLPTTN